MDVKEMKTIAGDLYEKIAGQYGQLCHELLPEGTKKAIT